MTDLTADGLVGWRRRATGLSGAGARTPDGVVRGLLAVQAQDHRPALWAVGQRCVATSEADLDDWFAAGAVIRTTSCGRRGNSSPPESALAAAARRPPGSTQIVPGRC